MASTTAIPRFLLPQRGHIWGKSLHTIRYASTKAKPAKKTSKPVASKPLVLEKPAKFNPPSHPQRIRTAPRQYPGPQVSKEDAERQGTKKYPNMMPPKGTFMYWFMRNKSVHLYITLVSCWGTLKSQLFRRTWANYSKGNPNISRRLCLDNKLQTQLPLHPHATPWLSIHLAPDPIHPHVFRSLETHD